MIILWLLLMVVPARAADQPHPQPHLQPHLPNQPQQEEHQQERQRQERRGVQDRPGRRPLLEERVELPAEPALLPSRRPWRVNSCMAAEMPVQATGRDMLVDDLGIVPLQEILGLLESMGIPCTAQDEAAARAAYAKAHAAFGRRRCVAVARD